MPDPQNPPAPCGYPHETSAEAKGRLLFDALADPKRRRLGVVTYPRVVRGRPAQLSVVGSRGGGGFAGLPPGSDSRAMPRHAYCSVAVVRGVRD